MHDPSRDSLLAHFYDLEYRHYDDDLAFYVQYALALDPDREWPLLELGCGTGRVTLALAEAGFRVTGVDSSDGMLQVCAKHAQERKLGERVTLVKADLREPVEAPGGPFNMAFCALNTFAYLTTTAEQLAMLNGVLPLLVQHGILIVDLTPPVKNLL